MSWHTHPYGLFPSSMPFIEFPLRRPRSGSGLCQIQHSCSPVRARTLARVGGPDLHSSDRRTPAVSAPLPRTRAHPLYWESGFICRALTSVSRPSWAPSPHPSWLRVLQAAVRRPHLFRSLVEIALAGNKRARARFCTRTLRLNGSRGVPRFSQMKLRLSIFFLSFFPGHLLPTLLNHILLLGQNTFKAEMKKVKRTLWVWFLSGSFAVLKEGLKGKTYAVYTFRVKLVQSTHRSYKIHSIVTWFFKLAVCI